MSESTTTNQLVKANRLISFSTSINSLIIHAKSEMDILQQICQISIQHGKFRMSWFGLANQETGYLDPISSSGHVDDYFNNIPKISFKDSPEGRGPAGRAYRERQLVINNDIADTTDGQYDLWRTAALSRGYRSSIGIPVFRKDKLFGVFSLYHSEPFFFSESERELMEDIGENLTFAINNLDAEKEKENLRKELVDAYDKLSAAHLQLDRFAYRASHDLRGPIASLLGLCVVCKMELRDFPSASDIVDKLESTAQGLDQILKRLIAAQDIKHRTVEQSPISFPSVFARIKDRFEDSGFHLTASVAENVSLSSDPELLHLAFECLVENSVQHKNPVSDRCHVHLEAKQMDNEDVRITILDNGVGISNEIKDRIFDMFFKGTANSKGPGIGLHIVKNIMEKLNGSITLSFSDHGRTQFEMVLPPAR